MKTFYKTLLAIIILYQSNLCFAQNNATYPIKEQYDKRNTDFVDNGYDPCNISPSNIPDTYGDGMSYVLESYMKMYETTKDKAYLIKFIINSICMHENRQDVLGTTNDPRWGYDPSMYQDGLIIWPMAHFVNQVIIEEPALYSLPLPQIPNTKITSNAFGASFNTYGDFAQWLRVRTEQTLDWYTYGNSNNSFANYWGDDTRCYLPSNDHSDRAQSVNMQAGFACALFYFGLTDPNTDYLHKAAQIAIAYKGTYTEKHPGLLGCLTPTSHTYPVLDLQSNNSYVWKTNGWREITCSDYNNGGNDYEDISHGVQTLIYPRAINNRLESNSVVLFDDYDMIRFRNTFSFNVYAGTSSGCPQFHPGVDGDDVINYESNFNGLDALKIRSLAWMPFYKYDSYSSTPDVYDIVMNYYACDILNSISNVATGLDFYGLSEVVSAQWDKECVNLTLYNRDVTYDQDFIVKNKLVVAPQQNDNFHQTGDNPFAEPKTFADNGSKDRFVVESGTTVNMVAGESIELLPGFEARAGSNFSASINPSACTDGMRIANANGSNTTNNIVSKPEIIQHEIYNDTLTETIDKQLDAINKFYFQNSLTISPNPFSETTSINFSIKDKSVVTLKIIDQYGREIFNEINNVQTESGNYTVPFNGQNLSKGIYFCMLQINGQIFQTQKIILIK